jgi:two-component system sensor histidine kinase CpxA
MKPSKIYLKIFFSFLVILIVTEILIFGLFGIIIGRHLRSEMDRYASTQVMMVKEILESKMRTVPEGERVPNESLKAFIEKMGELLGAKVWLQKEDGEVVAKSFHGNLPKEQEELEKGRGTDFGSFRLYHGRRSGSAAYAVVPIALEADKGSTLHVLFPKSGSSHPEGGFALGLGVIGAVIALLVIPVSRFISKPINELRHSAGRIAEGDLSHRATVKGKDEIGKLGRAFNHMADRLEKMIRGGRELTAHISHELRTPLTRIRIAEEMLREKMEQQNCAGLDRYLNDIREDIEELDDLIGRILTLSKFDLKERPLSPESFNPVDLMNGLLGRLKPAMDRKGLQLTTDISLQPPLWADRNALQTAFSNILENAVKYSPTAGRVKVEMKSDESALEVSVVNTADRVPEEEIERIFEPFHRLGTTKEGGFGLGLAIARKIIEAHGGTIGAQNGEDGFRIKTRLPINPAEQAT